MSDPVSSCPLLQQGLRPHCFPGAPQITTNSTIDALLGMTIECPVVDGEVTIEVPAGTKSGQGLRVRGNGAPKLGQPGTLGDHIVIVNVEIPKHLSKKEKAIFEQLKKPQDLKKENESLEVKEIEAAKEEERLIEMKEVEEEEVQNGKIVDEDDTFFGELSPCLNRHSVPPSFSAVSYPLLQRIRITGMYFCW